MQISFLTLITVKERSLAHAMVMCVSVGRDEWLVGQISGDPDADPIIAAIACDICAAVTRAVTMEVIRNIVE